MGYKTNCEQAMRVVNDRFVVAIETLNGAIDVWRAAVEIAEHERDDYRQDLARYRRQLHRLAEIDVALNSPDLHRESARDLRQEKNQILHGSPYLPE